jgi:hypothetical protein
MSRNAEPSDHQHCDFDQFITANHLGDLISIPNVIIIFPEVRYACVRHNTSEIHEDNEIECLIKPEEMCVKFLAVLASEVHFLHRLYPLYSTMYYMLCAEESLARNCWSLNLSVHFLPFMESEISVPCL